MLQEDGEIRVAFEPHLFAEPVSCHLYRAYRHVEQRRNLLGAEPHFQVGTEAAVGDVELRERFAEAAEEIFIYDVEIFLESVPVIIMLDVLLYLFLQMPYLF